MTPEHRFKVGDRITNGRYIKLVVGINSDHPWYMFKDGTSKRIKDIDKKYYAIENKDSDMTPEEKEQIIKELSIDRGYLQDWYQQSIDETQPPIWTDEHLDELYNDFYLIPKR